jgi:S1-C subfamily serine protease
MARVETEGQLKRIVPIFMVGILIIAAIAVLGFASPALQKHESLNLRIHGDSCTGLLTYTAELSDLENEQVAFYINDQFVERLKTDQNGRVTSNVDVQPEWCNQSVIVRAVYDGSYLHAPATTSSSIIISQQIATQAMPSREQICPEGSVRYQNNCMTAEEKTMSLIKELQQSVVKVEQPAESGSGVVLKQTGSETYILTNFHVLETSKKVSDIVIITEDGERVKATAVHHAPKNMDLAIVVIPGTHGKVAQIDTKNDYAQGKNVMVLGSPHGLQHSVNTGIVSNFMQKRTDAGYWYNAVQHDAAMNAGNSGGGLFLQSTGELIGINTFKMKDTEGINFAIDIQEFLKLGDYRQWQEFQP